ncbi:hypothetical protein L873DRAFT_1665715 [Choiromyces venosus 120613-1]|uniref:Uncharacterized protein n=1 Tax=Choiromyces venosus 120613-1 TaxID=1336337 RepID=A0A3N4K906_9PEZI|nr:hypothetical protein L873DRAFT_1665715 [Choiromyces venosus 120613-1]
MDEMEITSSTFSRGPEILSNPVIIESILPALEHMTDILSLLLVSRQTYLLVNPLHPFSARKLSFAGLAHVKNRHIIEFLYRPLEGVQVNSRRRLLEDGRTVTVSGGLDKGYIGAWRFLNSIDLSGTSATTRVVKLLIAATAGGKIPGLLPDRSSDRAPTSDMEVDTYTSRTGHFSKEFESISGGAYRLLADQSLRLEKLCVTDCPLVDIGEINSFLKKILIVVTAPKRRELRLKATQQLAAAQQQQNGGGGNAAAMANAGFGAIQQNPQVQAQAQAQAQQQNEDLSTVPSPLPATVEELEEFGLPCLSLRRLELANVAGLYVDPPEKYKGKKEWQYAKECPFGRNVGGLNSIAGCLGIDVDVLFCQGAGCATSFDHSRWRLSHTDGEETHFIYDDEFDVSTLASNPNTQTENPSQASGSSSTTGLAPGDSSRHNNGSRNPRKTYHYPLPRLPGERILIMDDGRVFRIPRHAIPTPPATQQPPQQQQQQQNVPAAAAPAQLLVPPGPGQGQGNVLNVGAGGAVVGGIAGGGAGIAPNNSQGWSAGQFLQDPAQYGLGVVGSAMPNTSALAHISQLAGLQGIQGLTAVANVASQIITGDGGTEATDNPAAPGQLHGVHSPVAPNPGTDGPLAPNNLPDAAVAGPSTATITQPANIPGGAGNANPGDGMNTALLDLMAAVQASTPPFGPTAADPNPPGGGIAPAAVGVGGFLPQIPHNHQNIFAQQQQPMVQGNMHNHFHHPAAMPPPPQQTHNQNQPAPGIGVSLGPRRRNNSPGGRTGSGATAGRPGRRIAMLDGPRGLCEGCGREVWLCENCNRYWVVTCGGCASRG